MVLSKNGSYSPWSWTRFLRNLKIYVKLNLNQNQDTQCKSNKVNTIMCYYLTSLVPDCTMYERQRGTDEVLPASTDKQTIRGHSD